MQRILIQRQLPSPTPSLPLFLPEEHFPLKSHFSFTSCQEPKISFPVMFALNWLARARQSWILFDNKIVGILTASRHEKAEQTHFPLSEWIICCLWEVVESSSLEVFKRCMDMTPGDMVQWWTWRCWVHCWTQWSWKSFQTLMILWSEFKPPLPRTSWAPAPRHRKDPWEERRGDLYAHVWHQGENLVLNMGKEGWTSSLQTVSCIYIKTHFPVWKK